MGQVILELDDVTLRKAAELAARKGVPLAAFLAHQIDELVAANDRYERAKASVASLFPETATGDGPLAVDDPQRFFDRFQQRPPSGSARSWTRDDIYDRHSHRQAESDG